MIAKEALFNKNALFCDNADVAAGGAPQLEMMLHEISLSHHEKRRNSLDFSERQRDGRRVFSFCRHLKDSLRVHGMNVADDKDDEQELNMSSNRLKVPPSQGSKTGRRVRFEEDKGEIKVRIMGQLLKPSSEMTESEKEALWWRGSQFNPVELTESGSDLHQTVPGSYASTLKQVYQACCSNTSSTTEEHDILSCRERLELISWTRVAISRRGLEFSSIPFLTQARKHNRENAILSVIELQRRMECAPEFDSNSKWDRLRSFSEKRTRPSRRFARLLAEADAAALLESNLGPRGSRRFSM